MDGLLVLADLLLLVVVCTVPVLLLRTVLDIARIESLLREWWDTRPRRIRPAGPPVERTAADLRRLKGLLAEPCHLSAVRYDGLRQAYDRLLVDACETLEIPQDLDRSGSWAHEVERLRIEIELERCGLVLSTCARREAR